MRAPPVFASLAVAQDGETLTGARLPMAAVLPIFSVSAPLAAVPAARRQRRRAAGPPLYYSTTLIPDGAAISQSQLLDAGIGFDNEAGCASTRWSSAKRSLPPRTGRPAAAASPRYGRSRRRSRCARGC